MIKIFFDYMLSGYSSSSIEIQKKAKILLIINFLLIIIVLSFPFFTPKTFFGLGLIIIFEIYNLISIILIKKSRFKLTSFLCNIFLPIISIGWICVIDPGADFLIFFICLSDLGVVFLISCIISYKIYYPLFNMVIGIISFILIGITRFTDFNELLNMMVDIKGILVISFSFAMCVISILVLHHNKEIVKIAEDKAENFKKISEENKNIAEESNRIAEEFKKASEESRRLAENFMRTSEENKKLAEESRKINEVLSEVISKSKEMIIQLNSSSKEIEASSQEQTSAANEHASGITEVSATLEELTITAKQITQNVSELVFSSEETIKTLHENEKQLLETVSQIDDLGKISKSNAAQINELGKRSNLINEMVELIKEVANKTNILSINASIEASRSGEVGTGFSVVAAEIRELSKETINSAKSVERAAREIQDFLNAIIISSESESEKVLSSAKTVKEIHDNVEKIVEKISNNYSFTQKIDVSIKQQESGSKQATDTMKQMAEVARQSAETARQVLAAVKAIVNLSAELDEVVKKVDIN